MESTRSAENSMTAGTSNQLDPSHMPPNIGSSYLGYDSVSSNTLSVASEYGPGSLGCHPYRMVSLYDTDEGVKKTNALASTQSSCHVTRSDDKKGRCKKRNPETMDGYKKSATTGYETLNKATMEPQTCSADLDGETSITHFD